MLLNDNEKRHIFLERLFQEFEFHTEGIDHETLELYLNEGDKLNEEAYQEFCDLEKRLQELQAQGAEIRSKLGEYKKFCQSE